TEDLDRYFNVIAASFSRLGLKDEQLAALRDFQRRPLLYNYPIDADSGAARIADAGFVAALKLLVDLQKSRGTAPTRSVADAFASGQAVLGLVSLAEIPKLRQLENAGLKLGICRVPGSEIVLNQDGSEATDYQGENYVPYLGAGGWLIALTPEAQGEAALDFL